MKTFVIHKRPFITGILIGNWTISISILGLLFLWPRLSYFENMLDIMGIILGCLILWGEGGVTFKQHNIGPWRAFWLLHPPFLVIWPRTRVIQRTLEEKVKFGIRYLFVGEIQCEELLLKPWPLCLYKVEIFPL